MARWRRDDGGWNASADALSLITADNNNNNHSETQSSTTTQPNNGSTTALADRSALSLLNETLLTLMQTAEGVSTPSVFTDDATTATVMATVTSTVGGLATDTLGSTTTTEVGPVFDPFHYMSYIALVCSVAFVLFLYIGHRRYEQRKAHEETMRKVRALSLLGCSGGGDADAGADGRSPSLLAAELLLMQSLTDRRASALPPPHRRSSERDAPQRASVPTRSILKQTTSMSPKARRLTVDDEPRRRGSDRRHRPHHHQQHRRRDSSSPPPSTSLAATTVSTPSDWHNANKA